MIYYNTVARTRTCFLSFIFLFILIQFQVVSFGQVTYVGHNGAGTLTGTNITINKPLNTAQGNLMIANITTSGNQINASATGWTLLRSANTGAQSKSTILYKIVRTADAGISNYTFALGTGATRGAAAIVTFAGVDTLKPIDTTAASLSTGNSRFPSATSITTQTANTALVMFGQASGVATTATFWNNSFWKATDPTALTELYDQPGSNCSVGAAWATKLVAGATGVGSDSISASCTWGAILVAIRSCEPKITTQPQASVVLCSGGTLSLSVTASGTNTYQWKKNGVNINAATNSSYTKANITPADSGIYTVAVTNACGTLTSQNSVVSVVSGTSVNIVADYCAIANRIILSAIVTPSTGSASGYTYIWSNGGIKDTTYVITAGIYSVKATPTAATTTSTGCSGAPIANISVSQELAVNGNFNLGNVGFSTPALNGAAYQYVSDSANYQRELNSPGRYGIGTNANNYNTTYQGKDHTTGTGNFMIVRGYSFFKPMVWQQTIAVTPNTNYYFSGWAMGLDSSAAANTPILRFLVNGNRIGNPLILTPHGTSSTSPDNWIRFYTTWNSGNSTSATFSIYDSIATSRGNGFGLDDISIGPLSPFITLTSDPITDTQTVCTNTPIQQVTFQFGSGGTPVVTGLPAGVNYTINGSVLTISGSPSSSGTFNYTVSTTGCSIVSFFGQIKSQTQNILLTSAAGTSNQSFCIGSSLSTITYSIIGNTNPGITGLPAGVSYTYISGILNIIGTPTQPGSYTYTISTSGGTCSGATSVTGLISVNALPVISIVIDSCTIPGRLILKAVPQISGTHTFLWNTGTTTDTLSVSASGNYTVAVTNSFGCRSSKSVTVSLGLTQTSSASTSNQNACLNAAITNITYAAGGNLISYNAVGLPTGVTATFNQGNIVIGGAPSQLGTYNFTLNFISSLCVAGPQTTFTKTGTIIVNSNPTVSIVADYCAVNNRVRLTATPVPTGTYSYLWSNGSTRDTAQVTTGGNFTISISNTFGCKSIASYSVGTEISINGNFNNGNTGFISAPSGNIPAYTFRTDSANFQGELVAPGFFAVDTNANNFNLNYWGHDHTSGSGKFMIIHGNPFQEPIAWQQTLPVEPNTNYYFSAWGMGLDSSANNASLNFSVNGSQIGNNLNLTSHGQSATAADNWRRFYSTWNSNNNTSATFTIKNSPSGSIGNGFGLDDISIGKLSPYLTITSNPVTDTQYICINTPIQPVTLNYGSGGTPTVTGLPTGVTATITNATITISGTPTVAGTFNYIVSTTGCNRKTLNGQIISQNSNLNLISAAATTSQSICINSAISNIRYTATASVTGLNVTGLPTGVNYVFNAGILTISGTPTISGNFTYNITISGGGCSATTVYTGTLTINARPTVNITVDYCTLPGRALLKAVVTPTGTNTFSWSNGKTTDTISVTTSGTYTVTVTNNLNCQTVASINVFVGIFLTSPATTNNQNVCLGDTSRRITYSTAGNITGISVSGLPTGVSYTFSSNTIIISGTPTLAGTFNYTITPSVSCGTVANATGTIRVYAKPTVTIKSNYCTIRGKIKLRAFPLPTGTYTYRWSNGATTDTTSVNLAGTYSVTVTNANGCSISASMSVSNELSENGNFNSGNVGFNTPVFFNQQYRYAADVPNVQTELNNPGFYGIGTNANNYNANYQGRDHTTGTGNFMIVNGFPFLQVIAWEKTITVSPNTLYYFSGWAQGLDSLNNNPILKFSINGTEVGSRLILTNHGQSPTSPDNWARFYTAWNSGTSTLASFAITNVQTFSLGNSFGLDDISIGTLSPFISLISSPVTDTQTVCLNTPIDTVVLNIGADSILPVVNGLPPGVNYTFDGYKLTISGSPTSLGTYNYSVTISGCIPRTFYGQIISRGQSLVLTSSPNTNNQSVCLGNTISNIVYNTGGNINSSNISVTGLPPGITYLLNSGTITISGSSNQLGTYNYTVSITGSVCSGQSSTLTASGTISIINTPTIIITTDYCSQPGKVKLKAIPTPSGAYTYYWNNGATTDTTSVDLVGNYTVTITNTNGCRTSKNISVSNELVENGNFNLGNTGFITSPGSNQRYVYVADSANYSRELLLPGRYGIGTNAHNYNDLYWGRDHTTGTGNFMIVHGYAFASPILWQDTVQVTPNTNYYFSAWGMSLNNLGNNGRLKFSINNTQIGNILNLPNRGNSDTSLDNWTRFYSTWNSGTSTTAILSITNTQTSFIGNSFGIDDISFASMAPFINLVSSPSSDTQTVCNNNPIIPISLNVGSGGTVSVTGLPPGVSYTFNGYNLLISGSPSTFGVFNYTISLSSNCAPVTFNGQIISRGQTLSLTSAPATVNQTICLRSSIIPIVMQSAGNITNVIATGLPAGIITSFNSGVFTISGIATQSGTFNYTVTTSGPFCTAATISGTLTIKASPTASISISTSTILNCSNPNVTLTASGGTSYNWNSGLSTNASIIVNNAGFYTVYVTNNTGCIDSSSLTITSTLIPNTSIWLGVNSNWNDQSNWCGGIPDSTKNVMIMSSVSNYPFINTNIIANCLDITINSGASLNILNTGSINIKGNLINNGTLSNNGKITLAGNRAQTFPGPGIITSMDTLEFNNLSGITLNKSIFIQKELRPTSGILALGDFDITLKSNSIATASVSVIGQNSGFTYGLGRFIVERYIATGTGIGQHGKSWQFISAPIRGTQTIKQSWQENAAFPNQNPNQGFGTQITGEFSNALSLGFDMKTNSPSMKTYDTATNTFVGVPNTNSYPIQNSKGYMIFIRGNRFDTSYTQQANPTTLRARGTIYARGNDAPPVINVPSGGYQSIGNPFPSSIDFSNNTGVIFNRGAEIDNLFYVWDPTLLGSNNLGGYQTISSVNNWIPIPGGTNAYPSALSNPKIQSGQAFFMHATGQGGPVTFTEEAKKAGSNLVTRNTLANNTQNLANEFFETKLFINNNGLLKLADGNLLAFNSDFSNDINAEDALKLNNSAENFGLIRNGKNLAIEARQIPTVADTIHYSLTNLRIANYRFCFNPSNFSANGLSAYLVDQHLQTSTFISSTDTTIYDFTVTNISTSAAINRFLIVFKPNIALPLTFTNINAIRKNENTIKIYWSVEQETEISNYEIERSFDGNHFISIQSLNASMNNGADNNYQTLDTNACNCKLFYRIKANKIDGSYVYSKIIMVKEFAVESKIDIFPNPVLEQTIYLQYKFPINSDGKFELYNTIGELVYSKQILFSKNQQLYKIQLPKTIAAGSYIIKLKKLSDLLLSKQIIIN